MTAGSTDEQQEAEWMEALCQGDRRAYQAIVTRHCQAISHYAFRMLGNLGDAEDITQETFLRLWLKADQWQASKAKLTTWLHRIAHNLCIDFMRKHSRLQALDETSKLDNEEHASWHDGENKTTEQDEQKDERLAKLNAALSELPEAQRSALMLCTYSGFSNQEAADIMTVSVKALESALARARRNLRTILYTDVDEEKQAT